MIPVYKTWITELEKEYVTKCMESGWIARGEYIEKFEELFAKYIGAKYALSTCNGSAACHLCVLASGLGDGKVVATPNISYVATANAIVQSNSIPLFLPTDDICTWNTDIHRTFDILKDTKADGIFITHLLGNPVNYKQVKKLAEKFNLTVIEDACESLGAFYQEDGPKVMTGNWGVCAAFSLFANKTASSGEGGVFVTNDEDIYKRAKLIREQGHEGSYYHSILGYNYRMANINAAIATAQMERIEEIQAEKKRVYDRYYERFSSIMQITPTHHSHSHWMIGLNTFDNIMTERIRNKLSSQDIESRPMFVAMNNLPYFGKYYKYHDRGVNLQKTSVILPSYPTLTNSEIDFICETIDRAITTP